MDELMEKIGWTMHENPPNVFKAYIKDNRDCLNITATQLDTIVHPSADWVLVMDFDGRSVKDNVVTKYLDNTTCTETEHSYTFVSFVRCIKFHMRTTVYEMLQKISEGNCYGYLEGFTRLEYFEQASRNLQSYALSFAANNKIDKEHIYVLRWGT